MGMFLNSYIKSSSLRDVLIEKNIIIEELEKENTNLKMKIEFISKYETKIKDLEDNIKKLKNK